jgi:hypothetical protein
LNSPTGKLDFPTGGTDSPTGEMAATLGKLSFPHGELNPLPGESISPVRKMNFLTGTDVRTHFWIGNLGELKQVPEAERRGTQGQTCGWGKAVLE